MWRETPLAKHEAPLPSKTLAHRAKMDPTTSAVVLWTGGKDSALALEEVRRKGVGTRELVTFVPPRATFRAHPLSLMRAQSVSLGIPHRRIRICPPFRLSYEVAIRRLREEGITTLVTGDIAPVEGYPNWLVERARPAGVKVERPLWGRDRTALLKRMLSLRFRPVFTAVRCPPFSPDWVGRPLDAKSVDDLRALASSTPFDICGEQGEYHTMVLDGPGFRTPVLLPDFTTARHGGLHCLSLREPRSSG
jgi:uncharacterized protein (TIGR00290 family)